MNSSIHKKLGGSAVILRQAQDTIRTLPKAVITAQERLRRKGRALVRVVLATAFLWLTTLFSIGAQLSASVSHAKESGKKRTKGQLKPRKFSESKNTVKCVASWYGKKFHGRKTASGVRYDQNAMMAAHKTLPFGTILRVTNLQNDRYCYVEVTDRGPYIKGRELDVSRAAAIELGFKDAGITNIRMEIVNDNIADYYKQVFFRNELREEARMIKAGKVAAGGVLAAID